MTNETPTPPAQRRFRVHIREELIHSFDVLAKDEEEARDLALEAGPAGHGQTDCTYYDADDIWPVAADDENFDEANAVRGPER